MLVAIVLDELFCTVANVNVQYDTSSCLPANNSILVVPNEATTLRSKRRSKQTPVMPADERERLLLDQGKGKPKQFQPVIHRDSEFSVRTNYSDGRSECDTLNFWQGATLLTADCLGTGLLALPDDVRNLGNVAGFGFLIFNLPINFYAGYIFHQTATAVEYNQELENQAFRKSLEDIRESQKYDAVSIDNDRDSHGVGHARSVHHDTATFDFIGMASAIFKDKGMARTVMWVFYINIFLVLGDYILVMSHALAAAFGEDNICIPIAGIVASTAMFLVSQMRTMAMLGRVASVVSLLALFIVVIQCLWEIHQSEVISLEGVNLKEPPSVPILRKLSSLGGVGFAVGSQKLFLNIRHELADRSEAPKTLALSLVVFGFVYVVICWFAGPFAPSFLFDAIPQGSINRRLAGVLLWMHVVVSYGKRPTLPPIHTHTKANIIAINSQALCSSLDRLVWHRLYLPDWPAWKRWLTLTSIISVSAYLVANAIPFFSDLVSLIGAMTTVPLTLLFPAVFFRAQNGMSVWGCGGASSALTYFALSFAVLASIGSFDSVLLDWSKHKTPFSCR